MNIALIGMPGCMKTTVGKRLAALTGMTFVDTDEEFVRREGSAINRVFAEKGEAYFRACECDIVKEVCALDGRIISCGGGTPLNAECRKALGSCFVVRLTATAECIAARTGGDDTRPLLSGGGIERIKKLMAEREEYYAACADITVDTTDKDPDSIARYIREAVKPKKSLKSINK